MECANSTKRGLPVNGPPNEDRFARGIYGPERGNESDTYDCKSDIFQAGVVGANLLKHLRREPWAGPSWAFAEGATPTSLGVQPRLQSVHNPDQRVQRRRCTPQAAREDDEVQPQRTSDGALSNAIFNDL
ncbi:hypothetical protein LTR10_011157 [Elasticomyces elasticus]|nr:hypothetical protein LTR10_011157 [Elasticomyces elasticus]KAK4966422.1 hypothetical protein LTR42_011585 [Elasticomyces elasticus]